MTATAQQALTLLSSGALVAALVALIRKLAPKVDGKVLVPIVTLVCSLLVSVLSSKASTIPELGWAGMYAVLTAVVAIGGTEWATRLAVKASVMTVDEDTARKLLEESGDPTTAKPAA